MNEKASINSIYTNLWAPTAGSTYYKVWLSCSSVSTT